MPIDRYKSADPFENHPLFKTEEQARLEETMDGVDPDFVAQSADADLPWPGEETREKASTSAAVAVPAGEIEDSGCWAVDRARRTSTGATSLVPGTALRCLARLQSFPRTGEVA